MYQPTRSSATVILSFNTYLDQALHPRPVNQRMMISTLVQPGLVHFSKDVVEAEGEIMIEPEMTRKCQPELIPTTLVQVSEIMVVK